MRVCVCVCLRMRTCKYYIVHCALSRQASTVECPDLVSNPICGLSISADTNAPTLPISPEPGVHLRSLGTGTCQHHHHYHNSIPHAMPQMSTTMHTGIVVSFIITLGIHYNSSIRGPTDKLLQWFSWLWITRCSKIPNSNPISHPPPHSIRYRLLSYQL